jgi:hypothetical protein
MNLDQHQEQSDGFLQAIAKAITINILLMVDFSPSIIKSLPETSALVTMELDALLNNHFLLESAPSLAVLTGTMKNETSRDVLHSFLHIAPIEEVAAATACVQLRGHRGLIYECMKIRSKGRIGHATKEDIKDLTEAVQDELSFECPTPLWECVHDQYTKVYAEARKTLA